MPTQTTPTPNTSTPNTPASNTPTPNNSASTTPTSNTPAPNTPTPNAHFQPDDRNTVIVEDCKDMKAAEKAADEFLESMTSCDEAGAHYQRIQVSGVQREGKYYFDVVVVQ